MILVADSSPLIALARIGRLELLRAEFGSILVPTAVWDELVHAGMDRPGAPAVLAADWIERRKIVDAGLVALLRRDLGAGESEAIVLAREVGADLLIMDERLGRAAARRLGLRVTGLVGVLIQARERGRLPDAEAVVNDLHRKAGFWLSEELRRLVEGHQ